MRKVWKVVLTVCTIICLCYLIVNFIEGSISTIQTLKSIEFYKDNISVPHSSQNLASHTNVFRTLITYLIFIFFTMFVLIALWIEAFKNTQEVQRTKAKLEFLKEEIRQRKKQKKEQKSKQKIKKLEKELNKLKSDE